MITFSLFWNPCNPCLHPQSKSSKLQDLVYSKIRSLLSRPHACRGDDHWSFVIQTYKNIALFAFKTHEWDSSVPPALALLLPLMETSGAPSSPLKSEILSQYSISHHHPWPKENGFLGSSFELRGTNESWVPPLFQRSVFKLPKALSKLLLIREEVRLLKVTSLCRCL